MTCLTWFNFKSLLDPILFAWSCIILSLGVMSQCQHALFLHVLKKHIGLQIAIFGSFYAQGLPWILPKSFISMLCIHEWKKWWKLWTTLKAKMGKGNDVTLPRDIPKILRVLLLITLVKPYLQQFFGAFVMLFFCQLTAPSAGCLITLVHLGMISVSIAQSWKKTPLQNKSVPALEENIKIIHLTLSKF